MSCTSNSSIDLVKEDTSPAATTINVLKKESQPLDELMTETNMINMNLIKVRNSDSSGSASSAFSFRNQSSDEQLKATCSSSSSSSSSSSLLFLNSTEAPINSPVVLTRAEPTFKFEDISDSSNQAIEELKENKSLPPTSLHLNTLLSIKEEIMDSETHQNSVDSASGNKHVNISELNDQLDKSLQKTIEQLNKPVLQEEVCVAPIQQDTDKTVILHDQNESLMNTVHNESSDCVNKEINVSISKDTDLEPKPAAARVECLNVIQPIENTSAKHILPHQKVSEHCNSTNEKHSTNKENSKHEEGNDENLYFDVEKSINLFI